MASEIHNLAKEFNTVFNAPDMYRRLVESVHSGIYAADARGNIIYANQAFVNILGYESKDQIIGLNLAEHLYVHPGERAEFLQSMQKTGFVRDYKVRNRRKDGSTAILSVTGNIIYGHKNETLGVEGVVHDLTQHSNLEEKWFISRNVVEQTADNVMITDKNGVITYVNTAFETTTGYLKNDIVGKTPRVLKSGKHGSDYYGKLWETILAGKTFRAVTTNKKKNGDFYIADQTISPIINEFGEIHHFVSIWRDITEKVRLEESLRAEKQKLEEIIGFDEKISAIRKSDRLMDFVVSKIVKILEVKKCAIMLIDDATKEFCVKGSTGIEEGQETCFKIDQSVAEIVIDQGKPLLVHDVAADPRFQGVPQHFWLGRAFMMAPIKLDEHVIGVIAVADKQTSLIQTDVFNEVDLKVLGAISREVAVAIENVNFFKELQYLTITDPLTGIHNFRYFTQSLEYEIKRLTRYPRQMSLMMMDIDKFKSYNDSFGHLEGDHLLKEISRIIKENLRSVDILCRYAGDEFVVILPETDSHGSCLLAERIRKAIESTEFRAPVTVSIGVACYKNGMTRHELTSKSDRALYQAKEEGKNKVCVFG